MNKILTFKCSFELQKQNFKDTVNLQNEAKTKLLAAVFINFLLISYRLHSLPPFIHAADQRIESFSKFSHSQVELVHHFLAVQRSSEGMRFNEKKHL